MLFFDGVCNLCNRTVQFVLKHDRKKRFRFAALQSAAGQRAAEAMKTGGKTADSVILLYRGRYYHKSAAALKTAHLLGGGWRFLYVLMLVPGFIRNAVYDIVARNRYKWFGKRTSCMMPTPEIAERFVS